MASTLNKNQPNEFICQQLAYYKGNTETMYKGKRINNLTTLPCAGINCGQVPNTQLAKNPVDIESFLYGIGATNLVQQQPPLKAHLRCLKQLSFFPRVQPYLPTPLVIEKCQRPVIFRR